MKRTYSKPETQVLTVNTCQMVCASTDGVKKTLVEDLVEDNDLVLSRFRTEWGMVE